MNEISKSKLTYISLFSSAGVGCYGFKMNGFECIATNELIENRLNIQRLNNKCKYNSGYISGDIHSDEVKNRIFAEIDMWRKNESINAVDVIVATPPCQGMSTVNYKKNNEQRRNSLVVEAIRMIKEIKPRVFVFENVKAFMKTICTDIDGNDKLISESIYANLSADYNIMSRVINFKNYGVPSSRPRTIVIGTLKTLSNITPLNLFPQKKDEITVREAIGSLKSLGFDEYDSNDIYHFARPYPDYMREWISCIKEGESALNNPEELRPYKLCKGERLPLKSTHINNKFRRLYWDRPGACIHTRNDLLCSQDTIHPSDDRVLSIRELMRLMTIPDEFIWAVNENNPSDRKQFLAENELNIRRCIGEAVPTRIMYSIASNIRNMFDFQNFYENFDSNRIDEYLSEEKYKSNFYIASFIFENCINRKKDTGSFFTPQSVVFESLRHIDLNKYKTIRILEPAVGLGAFIPQVISACYNAEEIVFDLVDISQDVLDKLKDLLKLFNYGKSIKFNFVCSDFLKLDVSDKKYDLVISNPPYFKPNSDDLREYRRITGEPKLANMFAFFLKKLRTLSDKFVYVIPKTFIMASEYEPVREIYKNLPIVSVTDYGVHSFKEVFIEILSITFDNDYNGCVTVENKLDDELIYQKQQYIIHDKVWLLYRNEWFDEYIKNLELDCFDFFRDRQITNKYLKNEGKYRVLRSKNITDSGEIVYIPGYDRFIDDIEPFAVKKYLDTNSIIMPNFTYNTRAAILPDNCVANGSVAFITPKRPLNGEIDLSLYATDEFRAYYAIVKNKSKFTINIDSSSIYYIGAKFL